MWVFEWTGDQFLPAVKDASTVYGRTHAYAFIAELLANKDVLEIASHDVSCSIILAQHAASVVSLVDDAQLANQASERLRNSSLQFLAATMEGLAPSHESRFDAVVCLDEGTWSARPEFLPAVKRLLKKTGVLFVSCDAKQGLEGLLQRLSPQFKTLEILGQGVYAGSAIWPIHAPRGQVSSVILSRDKSGEPKLSRGNPDRPARLIAVAGDGPSITRDSGSILLDSANELLEDKDKATRELVEDGTARVKLVEQYEQQLAERRESLAFLQEGFAWQKTQIASLEETRTFLEREVAHYRSALASDEEALKWRAALVEDLEARARKLQEGIDWYHDNLKRTLERLDDTTDRLAAANVELDAIRNSAGWRFVLRVRSLRARLLPRGGVADRLYNRLMSFSRLRGGT